MIDREQSLQAQMRATLALISPATVLNKPKRRVGGPNDGGYVMLDDLDRIGVCYSLGVGPDVSWDLEMAERGAVVLQYDHTVENAPATHPNFRHFRVGITHDEALAPDMKRLDMLLLENGHVDRDDMILKVDIEGHEWDALGVINSLTFARFRQIVVEFHGMRLLEIDTFRQRAHRLFLTLRQTHEVIHVHGNNYAGLHIVMGMPIADCLEVTFVNRRYHSFVPCHECFPGTLDSPNHANRPDWFLGSFCF
jgi:Methyltransferase FkbM domain